MSRRKVTTDELALWRRVAESTEKLNPNLAPKIEAESEAEFVATPKVPLLPIAKPAKPPQPRVKFDLQDELTSRLAKSPVQMDHKAYRRLKRGKLSPEGRIDLHGLTLNRAHPALTAFILSSVSSGKRLVLVITGKGRVREDNGPIPTPRGILRNQVPNWLTSPPLAQHVIQFMPAHITHGGEGAYYVYLRRRRS